MSAVARKYQSRISRLTAKLHHAETELRAERNLRRALSVLEFAPKQDAGKLRMLRRASTIHQKLLT